MKTQSEKRIKELEEEKANCGNCVFMATKIEETKALAISKFKEIIKGKCWCKRIQHMKEFKGVECPYCELKAELEKIK